VAVQLFGVGEAAFHGLFSSLVDALAHPLQPVPVDGLLARLPHMPGHHFGLVALLVQRLRSGHAAHCFGSE
jgi:hypothetical protein